MFAYKQNGDDDNFFVEQMLHEMENDPREAHLQDVGFFIPHDELQDWWEFITKRFPQAFPKTDKLQKQHAFGTKLIAGDPLQAIRVRVVGSKMVPDYDERMIRTGEPESQTKTPYYIISHKGASHTDLSMLDYLAAHSFNDDDDDGPDWKVGWDKAVDDETDAVNNKLIKICEQNHDKKEAEEDYRGMNYNKELDQWDEEVDGTFDEAFWKACFTPTEQQQMDRNSLLGSSSPFISNDAPSTNLRLRKLLMRIVLAYTRENYGGVIVSNQRKTKFQVLEFYNIMKNEQGQPLIDLQHANSPILKDAQLFFLDETIYTIECTDELAKQIENHLMNNSLGNGLNDLLSGLVLFQGRLLPIAPTATATNTSNNNAPLTSGITLDKNTSSIPDRTFGIELELSCAIGTQKDTLGYAIQEHTTVKVAIKERKLTRHGFRTLYLCKKEDVMDKESSIWTLIHDESIETNPDWAHFSRFELVSPILRNQQGLHECCDVIQTVTDTSAIQTNESMGMHVHIGVDPNIQLEDLKSICLNFVYFESAMDTYLGRTDNAYCRSNKAGIHDIREIINCTTNSELFDVMNPKGRYHKLNLDNLRKGKRPTIEFRQHPATSDPTTAQGWIRFCLSFVHNSIRICTANPFFHCNNPCDDNNSDENEKFELLFDTLIRDKGLKEYYKLQRKLLSNKTSKI